MLSLEECLDFCDLDPEEVEAIAEHEHVPLIVAAEMGFQMLRSPEGVEHIHAMLEDNAEHARDRGLAERAQHLTVVCQHFLASHPGTSQSPSSL